MHTPTKSVHRRSLFIITALGLMACPALAQVNIHMRCGSADPYTASDGTVFEGDRSYASSPVPKRGFVGGSSENNVFRIPDGTPDFQLYRFSRRAFAEYRFDVPNGLYAVRLRFNDRRFHGPGLRVFSVVMEGVNVKSGIDVVGLVGKDHAIDFTFPVTVADGALNIAMPATADAGMVSAISVQSVTSDAAAPATPGGLSALGSFRRNILQWTPLTGVDLAGYHVYRAGSLLGPFVRIDSDTVRTARHFDDDVAVGAASYYRVSAVDIWGNESPLATAVSAVPVDDTASPLPVYKLVMSEADLAFLDADVYADIYVPGTFETGGVLWPLVEARYRGGSSRNFHKENWKLNFPSGSSFGGRDKCNINAGAGDWTVMREKTSYDVFRAAGIGTPTADFVHLDVNGTFLGVYTDIEQMDRDFLGRIGLDRDGNLYKADNNMGLLGSVAEYQAEYTNESNEGAPIDDLIGLIGSINSGTDAEFAVAARTYLDVPRVLDWVAMTILVQDVDSTVHNYFLYHNPDDELWRVFPWDKDISLGRVGINGTATAFDMPLNLGAAGANPQALGGPNVLVSRLLSFGPFRDYIASRLQEWIAGIYSPAVMNPIIDANFAAIAFDGRRDVYKLGRQSNTLFDQGATELKTFVANRGAYVLSQIPSFAPMAGPYLTINEFMAANTTGARDNRNEYEDWIEIYNAGVLPVDMSGMYLTDDLDLKTNWRIPNGTVIPGGGWLLFWADDETNEGANHAGFKLAVAGEDVGLIAADGLTVIDSISFGQQTTNVPMRRSLDGSAPLTIGGTPTPGAANFVANTAPIFTGIARTPALPTAGQPATVAADVTDDHGINSVSLVYSLGGAEITVPMRDDGLSGDGAAADGRYGATIPGAAQDTIVSYYLASTDSGGLTSRLPPGASSNRIRYRVGYVAPALHINELMASNATGVVDDAGEFDDWIELYNGTASAIDLSGMCLSDEPFNPVKWRIPDGTVIEAGGFLLFWADEDQTQGPAHTSFRLSSIGETVALNDTDTNANATIDTVDFPVLLPDQSFGCPTDGAATDEPLPTPSPGVSNNPPPPPCPCDWNHADGLDSQDFFDFLESFFNGDADFNSADGTDSQDFFDFIDCFFTGCP